MDCSIHVGWDPREANAYAVAVGSVSRRLSRFIPIHTLTLADVRGRGLYTRPTETRDGHLHDVISGAPMATEHACARFLVPTLAKRGWALFMDGDMLARADLSELFDGLDPTKALHCVQHDYRPAETVKMDGQVQTQYARKNWSSLMAFNVDHPANQRLTVEMINTLPGRDLHRFCWLEEHEIGALDPAWNWLVGHSDPSIEPKVVHFTSGIPDMLGYEHVAYADEWRAELRRRAA